MTACLYRAAVSILAIGAAINAVFFVAFGAYITSLSIPPPRQSDVHLLFEMIALLLLQNFKTPLTARFATLTTLPIRSGLPIPPRFANIYACRR